ncbi:MAG: CHAT domain-containing protein, partial [Crocosphaera sp.]
IRGERADNLEKAIAAYNLSLEVYTREAFPEAWARTQNNLGNAYRGRIRGERADNLEKAIAAYNLSLEVRTREAFPEDWARTQNNLGNAYSDRIRGERAENLEKAIAAYNQSLEVYTPTAFPINCLQTGRNLGITGNEIEDWETAIKGYNIAIEAVETSRSWAATPQRKEEIMEAAIDVYISIVQACINNNQWSRALEYVERSKTRNLVELLANRELYPKGNIDQSILTELDRLRQDIHAEQRRLDNEEITRNNNSQTLESNQPQISSDRTHLIQLQQQLDKLIKSKITPIDPTFSLTQKVETIPYNEIQSLIAQDTAILEFYLTNDKILAFVVTSKQELNLWQSSPEDLEALFTWTNDYLNTYYQNKKQWIKTLPSRLESLSNILHINDIIQQIPNSIQQLIIIPHRFLHILPLHALPIADKRYNNPILQDRFPQGVNYNPSCQLLKQVKQRQRTDFNHLFAIQNPTEDLLFTDLEVTTIQQHFDPRNLLIKQEATKTAFNQQPLNNIHCSHFSCHGYFNVNNPLNSALILANAETETETKTKVNNKSESKEFAFREGKITDLSKCLTLEDIFKLDLPLCRLVTLSACETGLTDTNSLSDEYIGLPSGFLFSGSVSVVSSLWTVDDFATTFLMIKFYENVINADTFQPNYITIALQNAQDWLRNLTPEKGEEFVSKIEPLIDSIYPNKPRKAKSIKNGATKRIKEHGNYPFANPFYWSAFTTAGL